MKKLLVTGGCGFIGSNYILTTLEEGDDLETLVNLDLLTYAGNRENLRSVEDDPRYTFVHGSICDQALVQDLFERYQFDAVVHFAAESHVDRSITGPEVFVTTNVLGTQILLEAARRCWAQTGPQHRFVHVSTDEVYGSLGESGFFTEETPLAPNSPYSASKAGSDLLARSYFQTFALPVIITRCSNNYGPYQFPEKLIPLMITNALADRPLPVYGDGLYTRDWLFVHDHCRAINLVLRSGSNGQVYNIGGNNECTNLDIVTMILDELGKPRSLITHVTDRLGHDRRYAIDAHRMRTDLGWVPQVPFTQGIRETIRWYLENRGWWQSLLDRTKNP